MRYETAVHHKATQISNTIGTTALDISLEKNLPEKCIQDLNLPPDFMSFLRQHKWKWLSLLAWFWYTVQVSHAYQRQCHKPVYKIYLCQARFHFDPRHFHIVCRMLHWLVINPSSMCSALDSASEIGEFTNNLQSLSIHYDGCLTVVLSMYWLVHYLSFFSCWL